MKGAFIGDIVGSRFEWTGFREKEFDLFAEGCRVTDDCRRGRSLPDDAGNRPS